MTFKEWQQNRLESNPDNMAGAEVFVGTRLSPLAVGGRLFNGEDPKLVLEDYPYLTLQDLVFSLGHYVDTFYES